VSFEHRDQKQRAVDPRCSAGIPELAPIDQNTRASAPSAIPQNNGQQQQQQQQQQSGRCCGRFTSALRASAQVGLGRGDSVSAAALATINRGQAADHTSTLSVSPASNVAHFARAPFRPPLPVPVVDATTLRDQWDASSPTLKNMATKYIWSLPTFAIS